MEGIRFPDFPVREDQLQLASLSKLKLWTKLSSSSSTQEGINLVLIELVQSCIINILLRNCFRDTIRIFNLFMLGTAEYKSFRIMGLVMVHMDRRTHSRILYYAFGTPSYVNASYCMRWLCFDFWDTYPPFVLI